MPIMHKNIPDKPKHNTNLMNPVQVPIDHICVQPGGQIWGVLENSAKLELWFTFFTFFALKRHNPRVFTISRVYKIFTK